MAYTRKTPAKTAPATETEPEVIVAAAEVETDNVSVTTEPTVDTEKENLKAELEALKAQMKMMADMIASSKAAPAEAPAEKKPDRYITFINMAPGVTYLRGNSMYKIEGQFTKRIFTEREARMIVNNMPNAISQGLVYILDADFVKECDLEDVYRTLLSNKDLETLLKREPNDVIEIYKNASPTQKNIIIGMIIDKKLNAERIDGNILLELQNLSGRNLIDIEPLEKED